MLSVRRCAGPVGLKGSLGIGTTVLRGAHGERSNPQFSLQVLSHGKGWGSGLEDGDLHAGSEWQLRRLPQGMGRLCVSSVTG